jgi:hypothetical protein
MESGPLLRLLPWVTSCPSIEYSSHPGYDWLTDYENGG